VNGEVVKEVFYVDGTIKGKGGKDSVGKLRVYQNGLKKSKDDYLVIFGSSLYD